MKTYLDFAAKVRFFNSDPAVQQAAELAGVDALAEPTVGKFSTVSAKAPKAEVLDSAKLVARNFYNERFNQLLIDHDFGSNNQISSTP